MEDHEQSDESAVGQEVLIDCVRLLQDLEVQIADDPGRMEELTESVGRRGLLLPCLGVPATMDVARIAQVTKRIKRMRRRQAERVLGAVRAIQEIIREFEKGHKVGLDDIQAPPNSQAAPEDADHTAQGHGQHETAIREGTPEAVAMIPAECPDCGALLAKADKFCSTCGSCPEPLETKCPKCGEPCGELRQACDWCGYEFGE